MMADIEKSAASGKNRECPDETGYPMFIQRCYKKMMYPNETRPDYEAQPRPKPEVNPKYTKQMHETCFNTEDLWRIE